MQDNSSSDKLKSSELAEYDNIIIDLTKDRISQELDNINSDDTKASIIIGVVSAIFGLLSISEYIQYFQKIFSESSSVIVSILLPILFLVISFGLSLKVIMPRDRLQLVDPRSTNNDYANLTSSELQKTLKNELIENFEFIERARKYDPVCIFLSFCFLITGTIGILIILIMISKGVIQ